MKDKDDNNGRAGTRGVREDVYFAEGGLFHKFHAFFKVFLGLTRKTYHNVSGNGCVREDVSYGGNKPGIFGSVVFSVHGLKSPVASALKREVELGTEAFDGS